MKSMHPKCEHPKLLLQYFPACIKLNLSLSLSLFSVVSVVHGDANHDEVEFCAVSCVFTLTHDRSEKSAFETVSSSFKSSSSR